MEFLPRNPVLIVEDDEIHINILQQACTELGVKSVTALNGAEALAKASQNVFSVYSVDLMMPVLDGKGFIKELQEMDPNPIIIVQTGLDNPDTMNEIIKLNIFDYLVKPVSLDQFKKILKKALKKKFLLETESTP
jgi:DNA-binding NtrC family response regulator